MVRHCASPHHLTRTQPRIHARVHTHTQRNHARIPPHPPTYCTLPTHHSSSSSVRTTTTPPRLQSPRLLFVLAAGWSSPRPPLSCSRRRRRRRSRPRPPTCSRLPQRLLVSGTHGGRSRGGAASALQTRGSTHPRAAHRDPPQPAGIRRRPPGLAAAPASSSTPPPPPMVLSPAPGALRPRQGRRTRSGASQFPSALSAARTTEDITTRSRHGHRQEQTCSPQGAAAAERRR
jgi:hypothetical protein